MASKAGLLACGLLRGLARSRALSQSQETQSKTAAARSQVRSAAPDSASERARYRLPVLAPPSSAEGTLDNGLQHHRGATVNHHIKNSLYNDVFIFDGY